MDKGWADDAPKGSGKKVAVWQRGRTGAGATPVKLAGRSAASTPTTTPTTTHRSTSRTGTASRNTSPVAGSTRAARGVSPASRNGGRSLTPAARSRAAAAASGSNVAPQRRSSPERAGSPPPPPQRRASSGYSKPGPPGSMQPVVVKKRLPRIARAAATGWARDASVTQSASRVPGAVRVMVAADTTVWCTEANGNVSIREKDGSVFGMVQRGGSSPQITAMLFVPGSNGSARVLFAHANGTVAAIDAAKGERRSPDVKIHTGAVTALALLPNGGVATGGEDGALHLLDPLSMEVYGDLGCADSAVSCITAGARRIFTGTAGGVVQAWDPAYTEAVATATLGTAVADLIVSGRFVWASAAHAPVVLLDALTLSAQHKLASPPTAHTRIAACGTCVWAFHDSGSVTVWNMQTLEQTRSLNYGSPGAAACVARVAAVPEDVEVWTSNATDGAVRTWRDHDYTVPIWCTAAVDEAREAASQATRQLEAAQGEAHAAEERGRRDAHQARQAAAALEQRLAAAAEEAETLRSDARHGVKAEAERRKRAEAELGDLRAMLVGSYRQLFPDQPRQPHYGAADVRSMLTQIGSLAGRAAEAQSEAAQLAERSAALQADAAEASARLAEAEKREAEARAAAGGLSAAQTRLDSVLKKLAESEAARDACQADLQCQRQAEAQLAEKERWLRDREACLAQQEACVKDAHEALQGTSRCLADQEAEFQEWEQRLAAREAETEAAAAAPAAAAAAAAAAASAAGGAAASGSEEVALREERVAVRERELAQRRAEVEAESQEALAEASRSLQEAQTTLVGELEKLEGREAELAARDATLQQREDIASEAEAVIARVREEEARLTAREAALQAREAQMRQHGAAAEEMEAASAEAQRALAALETSELALAEREAAAAAQAEELRRRAEELAGEKAAAEDALRRVRAEAEAGEKQRAGQAAAAHAEEVSELKTDVAVMMTELERVQSELIQERLRFDELQRAHDAAREEHACAERVEGCTLAEATQLREAAAQAEQEAQAARTAAGSAGDALAEKEVTNSVLQKRLAEQSVELANVQADCDAACRESRALKRELESSKEDATETHAAEVARLRSALETEKLRCDRLGDDRQAAESAMNERIREMVGAQAALEAQLEELRAEKSAAAAEPAAPAAASPSEELQAKVSALEEDKARLKDMLERLKDAQQQVNAQLRAMGQEIQQKDEIIKQLLGEEFDMDAR